MLPVVRYRDVMDSIVCMFEENRDKLFAYIFRMTGNSDTAHDILQESFTRCIEHYRGREVCSSLLFTIARNAIIDHSRKSGRYLSLEDCPADQHSDQEHAAIVRDSYQKVLKGLQTLGADERDILSMVASSGLSYEEISRIMEMSVSNIKVIVHRARIKLKSYLEGKEKCLKTTTSSASS